ncbi:MAG: hypothetical protein JO130_09610 [Solirubrobacterales bacterium]|nr:hypothetical protein [Solirubrobacterales bacterium]
MTSAFSAARNRRLGRRRRPLSHGETLEVLEAALTFLAGAGLRAGGGDD